MIKKLLHLAIILTFLCNVSLPSSLALAQQSPETTPMQSSGFVKDNFDGTRTLTRHHILLGKMASSQLISRASANEMLELRVGLTPRNQDQLNALVPSLYDPKSPNYHKWLTPSQFTQQFGYSGNEIDSIKVKKFLQSKGLTVTGQSPNGLILHVSGQAQSVEHAFKVHIHHYQKPDGTLFHAPDADPTVPPEVAQQIVTAKMDNLRPEPALLIQKQAMAGVSANIVGGTGPGGDLGPNDIKTAYNINAIPANGSGQTVAVLEFDGYRAKDIAHYEAQFGIPNVNVKTVALDGSDMDSAPGSDAIEVEADIEMVAGIAPQSTIISYEGYWPDDILGQIATDNIAKTISSSWGFDVDETTELIFKQMAAQGQSLFQASGDSGAWQGGVMPPCDEPNATVVGWSSLKLNSNSTYLSESGSGNSGGGISTVYPIPSYQKTMASLASPKAQVSTTMRNIPDVALEGENYAVYIMGGWETVGGTSLSSPEWAAFTALVNQGLGTNGPLGFANPWLYQLAQNPTSYANDFHQITTGSNGYKNEPGYNLVTGLGSFNGINLYNDLVKSSAPTYTMTISAGNNGIIVPASATVMSGGNQTFTLYPATGYTGVLTIDGVPVTLSNNSYTLTNIKATHTIAASFIPATFVISISVGSHGSISPAKVTIPYNGSQTFTLTPNTGYTAKLTVDGTAKPLTNNTYTLTNVTATHTLAASFIQNTYTMTISSGSHGSISPTSAIIPYGGSQTFKLTPNTGYTAQLTVDGVPVTLTNNTYTLSNVTATHRIVASFPQLFVMTISAGSNGSISPTSATIIYGKSQIFTLTPNTGYTASLTVDGKTVSLYNNTYRLNDVTATHVILANFTLQTKTITVFTGSNGSVSPLGSVKVNYGSSKTFTVTPNAGYNARLNLDGNAVTLTNNSYTLNNLTANHIIDVNFTLQTETLTASAGTGGTIYPSGSMSVNYGTSKTFTLSPSRGYSASLTVDGKVVTLANNRYTLNNVNANHTVVASFAS